MPTIKPPKGTRDFYPEDLLRRRYITETWRAVSIRHGFEEIDGPTFELADLYAVKSGEGILSELFQAFSGKDEAEIAQLRETGRAPFALRPEFTPTLARMYAARAKQLPKPTRWFCIPNFFRAEKPQRGRLREFFQWNADVIGDDSEESDSEIISVLLGAMSMLGLTTQQLQARISTRNFISQVLSLADVAPEKVPDWLVLFDNKAKLSNERFQIAVRELASSETQARSVLFLIEALQANPNPESLESMTAKMREALGSSITDKAEEFNERIKELVGKLIYLFLRIRDRGYGEWCQVDPSIVRGLAYYTGTVFEVIAEGERAVAGGGRYDNLIELFGGPPTPACGFGMGDVVLSNLLDDNDLFPSGAQLMDAIARTTAQTSLRPEAFIVPASEEADEHIAPVLARLRRGTESEQYQSRDDRKPWHADRYCPASNGVRPLHARTTDKATRNLKKLLADAQKQFAKLCVIIHEPDKVQLKDFDANQDLTPADIPGLADTARNCAEFSLTPGAPNDIARAIVALLDH